MLADCDGPHSRRHRTISSDAASSENSPLVMRVWMSCSAPRMSTIACWDDRSCCCWDTPTGQTNGTHQRDTPTGHTTTDGGYVSASTASTASTHDKRCRPDEKHRATVRDMTTLSHLRLLQLGCSALLLLLRRGKLFFGGRRLRPSSGSLFMRPAASTTPRRHKREGWALPARTACTHR